MKFLVYFACVLFGCAAFATTNREPHDPQALKSQLYYLQNEIKSLESTLFKDQETETRLNQQLAQFEIKMGQLQEAVRKSKQMIEKISAKKEALTQKIKILDTQKQQQIQQLSGLLQHIYAQGQRERWYLLLNQNDISALSRLEHYYHTLSNDRKKTIKALITQLQLAQETQQALDTTIEELSKLQQQKIEEQYQLTKTQAARADIVMQLKQKLNAHTQNLSALKERQRSVENTLANLNVNLKILPEYIEPVLKFASQKHNLELPIQTDNAMLTAVLNHPKLSAKKTYIKAQSGTPVHAIYNGTVVFAEWLRGIGLLLIIDHGNGYMSLYGNNQLLYKSVGDKVETGEVIARVGQSGGQTEPGLYFELRKDGIALEPTEWFKLS